ncbi:MAG: SDR family NAD(P)-dependent oxidoreductase [Algoriphagus sp.]
MKDLAKKIVLITGGASGIGKIMARLMLERQARVVIWDISQEAIDATIAEFSSKGSIAGYQIDVSKVDQVSETGKRVKQEIGVVDVLINNAGIVVGKYFHEHSADDISQTMDINASAPMQVTREFLGGMITKTQVTFAISLLQEGSSPIQKCPSMLRVSGR